MFALGMESVLEFLRSTNWVVCRSGTRQSWEEEQGSGPGADAIRMRSQMRGEGGGRRTVGWKSKSYRQGPGEPATWSKATIQPQAPTPLDNS